MGSGIPGADTTNILDCSALSRSMAFCVVYFLILAAVAFLAAAFLPFYVALGEALAFLDRLVPRSLAMRLSIEVSSRFISW